MLVLSIGPHEGRVVHSSIFQVLVKVLKAAGSHFLPGSFRGRILLATGLSFFIQFGIFDRAPLMVKTIAEVTDVRPYKNSRRPRIWLRYKFATKQGKIAIGVARRYVKEVDAVAVGDLITIKYNSRRPSRTRLVSLSALPLRETGEAENSAGSARRHKNWIPTAVTGAAMLILGWLFYRLIASLLLPRLSRPADNEKVLTAPGARPVAKTEFERYRPKVVQKTARVIKQSRRSKVKQRAGWFG